MLACIFGPRGSGKSVCTARLTGALSPKLVIDPMGEHVSGYSCGEVDEAYEYLDRAIELRKPASLAFVSYDPQRVDAVVAKWIADEHGGTIVVDEADMYLPVHGAADTMILECIERGRHLGIDMYFATRRPAQLNRAATANADLIVAFRTHEPRDVKFIQDSAGFVNVRACMAHLREYESVWIWPAKGEKRFVDRNGNAARTLVREDRSDEPNTGPAVDDSGGSPSRGDRTRTVIRHSDKTLQPDNTDTERGDQNGPESAGSPEAP